MSEVNGADSLSRRERQIAAAYAEGATYREIGERLGIAPTTVRTHLGKIYRKLGVASKVALLRRLEATAPPVPTRESPSGNGESRGYPLVFLAPVLGNGPEVSALCTDIVADLRTRLARLAGLSLTTDRGAARYVIDGEASVAGGAARVYLRLAEAATGLQIWADRYDSDARTRFEMVDRIAARAGGSIRWRITLAHADTVAARDLADLSLEELLLLAGTRSAVPSRSSWLQGGRIAEYALDRAPDNVLALVMAATGLGLAEAFLGFGHTPPSTFDLALRRTEAALVQDNRSPFAHVVRAWLLLFARGNNDEAAISAQHALEIDPDYSMGHCVLGAARVFAGDGEAGAASAERAGGEDERDPYRHIYVRIAGLGHLGAGRPDRAAACFLRCDQLVPGLPQNLAGLAVARQRAGESGAAAGAVRALCRIEPDLRLADVCPLPYRDPDEWTRFADTLREAGMPA